MQKNRCQRIVFFFLLLTGIAACNNSNTTATAVNALITSLAGGTVTSGDGRLKLTVPAGALPVDTAIGIRTLSAAEIEAKYPGASGNVDFVYELTPDGLQFTTPINVELLLPVTADLDNARAMLTISNAVAENVQNAVYRPATGTITGSLSHFSDIAVMPTGIVIGYPKQITLEVANTGFFIIYRPQSNLSSGLVETDTNNPPTISSGTNNILSNIFTSFLLSNGFNPVVAGEIVSGCNSPGQDDVLYRVTYTETRASFAGFFGATSVTGSIELKTEITCTPSTRVTPLAPTVSVIGSGTKPEGVRKAGEPPYADGGTQQRFIVASETETTIFENDGTVVNQFPWSRPTFSALYLQPNNPPTGVQYVYHTGPNGGFLCPEDGTEGFCQSDFNLTGGSSNTTDAQCGRDANGAEDCATFCRVRAGNIACQSENAAGDGFGSRTDVFDGGFVIAQSNATVPPISYAPLSPTTGIGVTNDGYIFHIDHSTDTATELSSSAGVDVRSVACEQSTTGFLCAVQSFSDMQTTPCSGSNATDFACGTSVTTGDAVTVGVGVTNSGNMAVIVPSFTNASLHAVEFLADFSTALHVEFTTTDYFSLFAEVNLPLFLTPGHAEIDSINDTVIVSGNGSDNVIIIPIDDLAPLIGNASGITAWF